MRAIIGGLRYNTATATELGRKQYDNGTIVTLWRTPQGRYFITVEGGPTVIKVCDGISYKRDTCYIKALDTVEALDWASCNLDVDTVSRIFEVPDA